MKIAPFGMSTEAIRAELSPLRGELTVAVHRAKNPFNIGAIIRVAHSFLVKEIVLIGTEPYYEKAAMGMHKYETIVECETDEAFLAHIGDRPLLGVERDAAQTTLWEVAMPKNAVLLFGSENDGIPAGLLDACHAVMAIPMYGINHSYPVAIAAGMVLCEFARRRDPRAGGVPDSPGFGAMTSAGRTSDG